MTRTIRIEVTITVNQVGDTEGYGEVWYNPESILNILSVWNTQNKFIVMNHIRDGNKFIINKKYGSIQTFETTANVLYVYQVQADTL